MNALTIADALAGKFPTGTLTPPTGYPAIRVSTARLPNALPTSPWVLVTLPRGEVVLGAQELNHSLEYHVQFHYAKHTGDTARDMTAMLSWLGVLLAACFSDMDLGVSGIRKAYPTAYEFVVFTYADAEFYGWDITWVVDFRENQAMSA
jgi:hypothetical protein